MIRSAVFKLTFAYLFIIMALSIAFSFTLYRISDGELSRGLRRPGQAVFRETSMYDFDTFREIRLSEGRESLKSNLIILNIITFGAGFAASYLLARKTLEPIAEAMKTQMQFTADASHELRTPLTAMQTEIEVALRDKSLTKDEAKDLLKSNLEEVEKLRELSDGLLKLAQHSGKKLTNQTANVYESIVAAVDRVSKRAELKKIIITPTIPEKLSIKGDPASVTEITSILLDNAIKYSPEKSKISITAKIDGGFVVIRVIDEGMGIDTKDLPHIFDRFYRADASRAKSNIGGYGLGLSIAKKIVDINDGSIFVEKTSKKGSVFAIKLHKA